MRTVWASQIRTPDENRALADWASLRLFGDTRGFGPCCTMGVIDKETLVAVMVYHNYDRDAGVIEMSGASTTPRWLARPVLREMFAVPFETMGVQQIVMRVAPDNGDGQRGLQRSLRRIGFVPLVLPRMRGKGKDDVLWRLTDDAWGQSDLLSTDIPRHQRENMANAA